ncbi:ornithine carbamoyltransferase [Listeria fleischmannii]|uniref:ornithine carbamoyltransferase n=1 Tax=Listeria fleischmannii TaxID=1069827 RepID=UPI00162A858F|nr:ornithine carbamoyltransferase [Listeria fleischmannii]MBC1418349.1 ornithine carbamoyltransferase [Listeria fleischmannii]
MQVKEENTYGKDMLTLLEWEKEEILDILTLALDMKTNPADYSHALSGEILGMIFDKPSTRTRVSFEAGMLQLGGQAIVMNSKELQIGRGEPIKDTAKVLDEYLDAIMIRTFSHKSVEELASYAKIPIINGLTDEHHPCQALADLLTIFEIKDQFDGVKLAYIGDGNNVCHSLLLACAKVGLDITCATPENYAVNREILALSQQLAEKSGSKIIQTTDAKSATNEADFIYTDVWTSMGQEEESKRRLHAFLEKYQVNETLVRYAKPNYHFLHCLPAHRGEEVTSEVIDDAEHSLIYQQAGNRLHVQKALLLTILKGSTSR